MLLVDFKSIYVKWKKTYINFTSVRVQRKGETAFVPSRSEAVSSWKVNFHKPYILKQRKEFTLPEVSSRRIQMLDFDIFIQKERISRSD